MLKPAHKEPEHGPGLAPAGLARGQAKYQGGGTRAWRLSMDEGDSLDARPREEMEHWYSAGAVKSCWVARG